MMAEYFTLDELSKPNDSGYLTLSDLQKMQASPAQQPAPSMSRADKMIRGATDPIEGAAQLLTHLLPDGVVNAGNRANNWLADKTGMVARIPQGGMDAMVSGNEQAYQAQRAAAGESGFDGYRVAGNILSPANIALAARLPVGATMAGRIAAGAGGGAATALSNPVTEGDYWGEKAKQVGTGAAFGGAVPFITGSLSRTISPKASVNPDLAMLKAEGVRPTIGQTLGGIWNSAEEKMQNTVPIVGDMVANARGQAREQFNQAAINRAAGKVGVTIDEAGQNGVARAGNAISQAYDDALSQIKVVRFDQQFAQDVTQLKNMAQSLTPDMRNKFEKKLQDVVGGRMSGNGSMLGETYKKVDSEIGGLARKFSGSSVASESELGDAFSQLQNLLKQQAMRTNPKAADALKAADSGWANLVRVEGAAKSAKNAEGVFTPAQLNMAVQQADQSTRGRSVARGTALMQDLATAGQNVLGNKIPDSGTAGRLGWAAAGASALASPVATATGLLGGSLAYTPQVQSLLRGLVSSRPKSAQAIADELRQIAPFLVPGGAQIGLGLLN